MTSTDFHKIYIISLFSNNGNIQSHSPYDDYTEILKPPIDRSNVQRLMVATRGCHNEPADPAKPAITSSKEDNHREDQHNTSHQLSIAKPTTPQLRPAVLMWGAGRHIRIEPSGLDGCKLPPNPDVFTQRAKARVAACWLSLALM